VKQSKPIFYDEKRRRWFFTRRAMEVSGAAITLLVITFLVSVLRLVALPSFLLPDKTPVRHAVPSSRTTAGRRAQSRPGRKHRIAALGQVPLKYEPIRAGFYVPYDPNSLVSLQHHYRDLDLLIPEELHTVAGDGSLSVLDNANSVHNNLDTEAAVRIMTEDKLHQWLRAAQTEQTALGSTFDLSVMALVNNSDGTVWQTKPLEAMLANPEARKRLEYNLMNYALEMHEVGICVDFEDVSPRSQSNFKEFAAEFAALLHANALKLMVALPAADWSYDYAFFGKKADAIVLMNYDQHWPASAPGPIAAQDWFIANLTNVLKLVPPEKIMMGIANYGYDWIEPPKKGKSRKPAEPAQSISVQQAFLTSYESEAEVQFDPDALNPHYSYSDEFDRIHQVWFTDGVTAYNELRASERAGVQGTVVWRLGMADTSMWAIWDTLHPDDATRAKLKDMGAGPDLILEGSGDIWRILDTPKRGIRDLDYDPASDTIIDDTFKQVPLSWRIEQVGAVPHKIAITFDDGPDPSWTPRILDILKEKNAPATFFVIGTNANRYPALLKREYNEGHEIGNHTYSHEHFDEVNSPAGRIRWELNLSQRLIESTLGVKTVLFRPPYGIDHQPETTDEVALFPIPQDMGYMLVGAWIDPHDWGSPGGGPPPAADEILRRVISDTHKFADSGKGNIIMFHDGGGDRSHTVEALPRIIDALRAAGYEIVPVSSLVNQTRAQVMPVVSGEELWAVRADSFVFGLWYAFRVGIALVFITGILLVSGRALIIGLLALVEKLRTAPPAHPEFRPPVSVLIPAYNEEDVIVQTVTAALAANYPDMEVVVVDDGSTDGTAKLLDENFGADPRVRIIHQPNRGKPAALAHALEAASSPIVVTIDADTSIAPDAISKLVRDFADPRVGAVAGNVKVGNRTRWLTRWQALEYITSQNMEKRAFDLLNCIPVVPGAVGAWRVEAIQAAGGFTSDTVAEDTDLTIAIRRAGWRISYDEEAIGFTQAPETAGALIRQRFRWTFGTLQSVWKHRDTLGRLRYGTLGCVALPNIFLFQFLLPLFSPLIDLMFLASVFLWALARFNIVTSLPLVAWSTEDLARAVIFFLGFMLIDLLACVIAFALEKKEDWSLLLPLLLQRFYYRQMMYVVLFRALWQALKGRPVGWRGVEPEPPKLTRAVEPSLSGRTGD
jgi:cellulose synthase/poly-beta-1,6-N-acetylglucosamine synthase-like glycosyltransferase/spore germination protein YaaH/peptidoglycan/xylan/chitin deacetylase (PgdA/CDA1 family)